MCEGKGWVGEGPKGYGEVGCMVRLAVHAWCLGAGIPTPTAAHPQGDSALRYASRRIGQTSLKRSEVSIRNGVREGVPFDRC